MALFTSTDVLALKIRQNEKRNEKFVERFSKEIEDELSYLENMIRWSKEFFLQRLYDNISGIKTSEVDVSKIRSFGFSKVGGGYATCMRPDSDYLSYDEYVAEEYPESFKTYGSLVLSRFRIWKSKDFLKKLAEKLELPKEMYFTIWSKKIKTEDTFFKDEDISEYEATLRLVIRFA